MSKQLTENTAVDPVIMDAVNQQAEYYLTGSTVSDMVARIMANPGIAKAAARELVYYRNTYATSTQKAFNFDEHLIIGFSKQILCARITADQRQGLLDTLSLLSDAYNPSYIRIHPGHYGGQTKIELTGEEYAENMVAMLAAYFKDFDINAKDVESGSSLMIYMIGRYNLPVEFRLDAAAVYVSHGADLNTTYLEYGNTIQQIRCTDYESFALVSGLVNMGADPLMDAPFKAFNGNPFNGGDHQVVYSSYFDYVKAAHEFVLPKPLTQTQGSNFTQRKKYASDIYEYLKRLKLSKEAINDCDQPLNLIKRKTSGRGI